MSKNNAEKLVECQEGWDGMVMPLIDLCNLYDIQVLQVKEKFGGLRFYAMGERLKEVMPLIQAAEARSYQVCEYCGQDGQGLVTTEGRWLKTLCKPCRDKRDTLKVVMGRVSVTSPKTEEK